MQAIPTQFKGIHFKSKTEAMFALILDLQMDEKSRWIYEPENFKTSTGYIPDFSLHYGVERFLSDFICLAEVKPQIPNDKYIQHLQRQFSWIKKNDKFGFIDWYALFIFNPYRKILKYALFENGEIDIKKLEEPEWLKDEYFDIALNYRFDINH